MNHTGSGQEKIWFSLNSGTWPIIKIDGAQKYAAAQSLTSMISAAAADVGAKRMFSGEHLHTLALLDAELRSDLAWQTGNWAAARNVLGGTVNALASAALGVLSTLGPPQHLVFSALYASLDEVFRHGAVFEPEAWRVAITKAIVEAGAEDVLTGGNVLKALLLQFSRFAQRLIEMQDDEVRRRELKGEIQRQLNLIRLEMQKYQNSYQDPKLLEAVAQELNRQPAYVTSVVNEYQSLTGKVVAFGLPVRKQPSEFQFSSLPALTAMPFSLLLAIRSREDKVKIADEESSGAR